MTGEEESVLERRFWSRSASGQKQTFHRARRMSALPPKADMDQNGRDVC